MLFEDTADSAASSPIANAPLAVRMRPATFDEYVGQDHIIGSGRQLRRAIEADRFTSIILYGPPGVGKTTLAELIATVTEAQFDRLSAVTATVKDARASIDRAHYRQQVQDQRTVLFLDEIHRFNKAQQDVLLPAVEDGTIRLIGATTENPFFHIVGPLVSRAQVFQLRALAPSDITGLLLRACEDDRAFPGRRIEIDDDAMDFWCQACEGDARRALTAFEIAVLTTEPDSRSGIISIDCGAAQESLQQKAVTYGDDGHYDTISAFIKSMRGSDPDAAVYWLAKMLEAGEDPIFIARRIVIFASEDVGNADPRAINVAVSAMQAVHMIGMPEARIILSQACTYCATAPKSNAAYVAVDKAIADVRENRVQPVPEYLRDAHYKGAKSLGHGQDYDYPHDTPEAIAEQTYLAVETTYYEPVNRGYEQRIRERLDYWASLKEQRKETEVDEGQTNLAS
ncbi:MAG: replication-associated recombination protein A [Lentisphaeria bacterium]